MKKYLVYCFIGILFLILVPLFFSLTVSAYSNPINSSQTHLATKSQQLPTLTNSQRLRYLSTVAQYTHAYYSICYANSKPHDVCNDTNLQQAKNYFGLLFKLYLFGSFSNYSRASSTRPNDTLDYDLQNTTKPIYGVDTLNSDLGGTVWALDPTPVFFSNDIKNVGKQSDSQVWKDVTVGGVDYEDNSGTRLFFNRIEDLKNEVPTFINTFVESCQGLKELVDTGKKPGNQDPAYLCSDVLNVSETSDSMFKSDKLIPTYLRQMIWNTVGNGGMTIEQFDATLANISEEQFEKMNDLIAEANGMQFSLLDYSGGDDQAKEYKKGVLGPLSWLLTIVGDFLAKTSDNMFEIINSNFLAITTETTTNELVRPVWQQFRNLANIALIIAFLVIIFSQITGFGLSNYGIKSALPKLILAVVIINLSFYIAQFLIDTSNIIGQGIYSLFSGTELESSLTFMSKANSRTGSFLGHLISLLMLILAMVLTFLASLINIILLSVRDALVIILVITSPLAFVSIIFPKTNRISQIWWRALFASLTIFVCMAALVGGGKLAHNVLISAAGGSGLTENIQFILAKLAFSGALIASPYVALKSLSSINLISNMPAINRLQNLAPIALSRGAINAYNRRPGHEASQELRNNRRLERQARSTSRFGIHNALVAQQELNRKLDAKAKLFTVNDADKIVEAIHQNREPVGLSSSGQQQYQLLKRQFTTQQIAQIMSRVQQQSVTGNTTDNINSQSTTDDILQGLNAASNIQARDTTPSTTGNLLNRAANLPRELNRGLQATNNLLPEDSADAKDRFDKALEDLRQVGDFRTAGIMLAHQQQTGHYAGFNLDDIHTADTSQTLTSGDAGSNLQAAINQQTRSELRTLAQGTGTKSQNFVTKLRAQYLERHTVANRVFIEEMNSDQNFRDTLIDNYDELDSETKSILDFDQNLLEELRNLSPDNQDEAQRIREEIARQIASNNGVTI